MKRINTQSNMTSNESEDICLYHSHSSQHHKHNDEHKSNDNIDYPSIPKIDIHNHILPKDIPDFRKEFGYGNFITLKHDPDQPGTVILCLFNNIYYTYYIIILAQ